MDLPFIRIFHGHTVSETITLKTTFTPKCIMVIPGKVGDCNRETSPRITKNTLMIA